MADFKDLPSNQVEANTPEKIDWSNYRPLFEDFNLETEGGLLVNVHDGSISEKVHPKWGLKNPVSELPFRLVEDGNGGVYIEYIIDSFEYRRNRDLRTVTLGSELEFSVSEDGIKHDISETGDEFVSPEGSSVEFARVQPEAFKSMAETDTGLTHGFDDYKKRLVFMLHDVVARTEEHGIDADFMSVHPHKLEEADILDMKYVQNMNSFMPSLTVFRGMSMQINMGQMGPEHARHALAMIQMYEATISLLTAADPMYDRKFDASPKDMFGLGEYAQSDGTVGFRPEADEDFKGSERKDRRTAGSDNPELLIKPDDILRRADIAKRALYSTREVTRAVGSPSGGAWEGTAPISNIEYFREADKKLRDGSIVSSDRTESWHGDRPKVGRVKEVGGEKFDLPGNIEICSLSAAGGNVHILKAMHELTIAFCIKQQKKFDQEWKRASEEAGFRVDPGSVLSEDRELSADIGHANNFFMSISGKETGHQIYHNGEYKVLSPDDVLELMIAESGGIREKDGEDGISQEAAGELRARVKQPPALEELISDEELQNQEVRNERARAVLNDFFSPGSSFTALEAMQAARKIGGWSEPELIQEYSRQAKNHIKFMYEKEVLSVD